LGVLTAAQAAATSALLLAQQTAVCLAQPPGHGAEARHCTPGNRASESPFDSGEQKDVGRFMQQQLLHSICSAWIWVIHSPQKRE